jgi:hypothetical protein
MRVSYCVARLRKSDDDVTNPLPRWQDAYRSFLPAQEMHCPHEGCRVAIGLAPPSLMRQKRSPTASTEEDGPPTMAQSRKRSVQ